MLILSLAVMSLSIQMDLKFAWSVSADNMVGRYDLVRFRQANCWLLTDLHALTVQ